MRKPLSVQTSADKLRVVGISDLGALSRTAPSSPKDQVARTLSEDCRNWCHVRGSSGFGYEFGFSAGLDGDKLCRRRRLVPIAIWLPKFRWSESFVVSIKTRARWRSKLACFSALVMGSRRLTSNDLTDTPRPLTVKEAFLTGTPTSPTPDLKTSFNNPRLKSINAFYSFNYPSIIQSILIHQLPRQTTATKSASSSRPCSVGWPGCSR